MTFKSHLDASDSKPPFFNEREVWRCYVGENVGVKINGKGDRFRRPVLVIKRLNRYSFIGVPLTMKFKEGDRYEVVIINKNLNTVLLSQIRHFDYRRMNKILCSISNNDFKRIINSLTRLLNSQQ